VGLGGSRLDEILGLLPGVSRARAAKMVSRYGSLKSIAAATIESIDGMGFMVAQGIYEFMHQK